MYYVPEPSSPLPPARAPFLSVLDLGAAPGGWSMVAARIVHSRASQKGVGSTSAGVGRQKRGPGGVPSLPPPLEDAPAPWEGTWDGEVDDDGGMRRRARDAPPVVVAVDLLEMDAPPGVEVILGCSGV